ncbi:MAG: hypothetical protein ACK5MU_04945 [Candidatus Saccharimonadales bacterium]
MLSIVTTKQWRLGSRHQQRLKVLSLSVGRNNSTNLVRKVFDLALAGRETRGLTAHTDRGTPYTSCTMREILKKHGKNSLSRIQAGYMIMR